MIKKYVATFTLPNRNVHAIRVWRQGELVVVEIIANAFLHHMVRNIVGSLIEVGRKAQSVDWLETLLQKRDRTQAPATAPANGLYLVKVTYPEIFKLPTLTLGPQFISSD